MLTICFVLLFSSLTSSASAGKFFKPTFGVPDSIATLMVKERRLYAVTGTHLKIFSLSDPALPQLLAEYRTPNTAQGVAVAGGYAYVADGDGGLALINISNPNTPALAGIYDTPGAAGDVAVADGYAYVADDKSGLLILDINDKVKN